MNLLTYLHEVKVELSKVTWSTRAEATKLTVVILVASLLVGLYIGALDFSFTSLLGLFIQ